MKSKATKSVYLTEKEFERDLEICLLIIREPNRTRRYYVCEYTSAELKKSIVHVHIINY